MDQFNSEEIKKIEDEYKQATHGFMLQQSNKLSDTIIQTVARMKDSGIEENIPNIYTTAFNKISEISLQFQKAGTSMFIETNKKYGIVKCNTVGYSVIVDILCQVLHGADELLSYSNELCSALDDKNKQLTKLSKFWPFTKLYFTIRGLFADNSKIEKKLIRLPQQDIDRLKSKLSNYKEMDNNLWNYDFKEHLEENLVKEFTQDNWAKEFEQEFSKDDFRNIVTPILIDYEIKPTLTKLGMENIIPQIKKDVKKDQIAKEKAKEETIKANSSKNDKINSWELNKNDYESYQIWQQQLAKEFKESTSNDKKEKSSNNSNNKGLPKKSYLEK